MDEMTTAQQLLPVKLAIGRPVYLRPYEQVVAFKITDEEVNLSIRTYEVTETAREVRFHKSGIRIRTWKTNELGIWKEQFYRNAEGNIEAMILWDDDFKPYVECRFGHSLTPDEYMERVEREAMTYRPGTSRFPLSNYHATMAAGPTGTTPDMFKYWKRHYELLEGDDDADYTED
jgi:hypothetical protein